MILFLRLILLAILALAVVAGGLYYYGTTLKPNTAPVEKLIPNDRFPQ
jgi:hypothetical protein